jgi:hypothetical protein
MVNDTPSIVVLEPVTKEKRKSQRGEWEFIVRQEKLIGLRITKIARIQNNNILILTF